MAKLLPSVFMTDVEATLLESRGIFASLYFLIPEGGYFHIQATKPDTVGKNIPVSNQQCRELSYHVSLMDLPLSGASLTDSPLGLAAYIVEKFYTATNLDTVNMPLEEARQLLPMGMKKVLYNVMVYWHSNTIMSSVRLYKESVDLSEAGSLPL